MPTNPTLLTLLYFLLSGCFMNLAQAVKNMESQEDLRPWMRELLHSPAPKRVRPGVIRYEKSYERTNKNTGEHLSLRYTTERNEDAFINLDTEPELVSVDCREDTMILQVKKSFSISGFLVWRQYNNTGRLIYGGIAWECRSKNGEISPIFKSMASSPTMLDHPNSTFSSLTFKVQDASPFSFFGRLQQP
jgi:hypothetical protein